MKFILAFAAGILAGAIVSAGAQETFTAFAKAFPAAALPLAGTETVLVIQGGVLKSAPVSIFQTQIAVTGTITPGLCPTWTSATPPTIGASVAGCLLAQ